mmetsp:Transcript_5036/g.12790  ORF Transcript_5036/g.12790 Transcript_5036/m.12790 type:complete len:290 (-) Transcript_5036:271-1140(-)
MIRVGAEGKVGGDVHFDHLALVLGEVHGVVEGRRAIPHLVVRGLVPVCHPGGHHVRGLAAPNLSGVLELGAALPLAHGERVSRGGHGALAKVEPHPHGVAIHPAEVVLGLGQGEAAVLGCDERLGHHVKLAHGARVGAAVRQLDDASVFALLLPRAVVEEVGALPHPRLALILGQGIHVQHRLPLGLLALEVLHGGAAPDALDVVLILPEVVHKVPAQADAGDLLLVVVDGAQAAVHGVVLGLAGTHDGRQGAGVLRRDPRHGLIAAEVLQEHVRGRAVNVARLGAHGG